MYRGDIMRCEKKISSSVESHVMISYDSTSILFSTRGTFIVNLGFEKITLSPGDTIIVNRGEPYFVTPIGDVGEYFVFEFSPKTILSKIDSTDNSYEVLFLPCVHSGRLHFSSRELSNKGILPMLQRASEKCLNKSYGYEIFLLSAISAVISFAVEAWQSDDSRIFEITKITSTGKLMKKAMIYLDEHPDDMSEQSCAAALGVSTSYLSRIFKRVMSLSFCEYTNSLRLKKANRMLISTDVSVAEISNSVGFTAVSYFISSFKSKYGLTPSKYREKFFILTTNNALDS